MTILLLKIYQNNTNVLSQIIFYPLNHGNNKCYNRKEPLRAIGRLNKETALFL